MTAEEYFELLFQKYGDDFNWMMIPLSTNTFVEELKRELGSTLPNNPIYAVAKCKSNDDVLFLVGDVFRIYHLTYARDRNTGLPKYIEFEELSAVMKHIEKEYLAIYL